MEESINSSVSSALCSEGYSEASGESSWTMYFEDFLASEEERKADRGFSSGSVGSGPSSVVSDAVSCTVLGTSTGLQRSEGYSKLRLKRRKGWCLLDDDPLEDTASSPVNSPKVSDLSHTAMEPRKRGDHGDVPEQEGNVVRWNGLEMKKEGANGFNCIEQANECVAGFYVHEGLQPGADLGPLAHGCNFFIKY